MSVTLIYANQVRTSTFPVTITEKIEALPEKPRKPLTLVIILSVVVIIALVFLVLFIIKKRYPVRERNL